MATNDSIKLRDFLANLTDSSETPAEPAPKKNYNTLEDQLNSISWQLKRIADALERKNGN